jgi:hypothetical protein
MSFRPNVHDELIINGEPTASPSIPPPPASPTARKDGPGLCIVWRPSPPPPALRSRRGWG